MSGSRSKAKTDYKSKIRFVFKLDFQAMSKTGLCPRLRLDLGLGLNPGLCLGLGLASDLAGSTSRIITDCQNLESKDTQVVLPCSFSLCLFSAIFKASITQNKKR